MDLPPLAAPPGTGDPGPPRAAYGVLGLLLVALSVAALAASRAPPSPQADPAPTARRKPPPAPAAARLRQGGSIDVNRAGRGDLELLPGIGPRLSERIVAQREHDGPFASIDALARVQGIGPRTVERLRPLACAGTCPAIDDSSKPEAGDHRSNIKTTDVTAAR